MNSHSTPGTRPGPILRFTPAPWRLFLGRLWREGGALALLLPGVWMLFGVDPATRETGVSGPVGWPVWLLPTVLVYAVLLALGLRARVQRTTLWLEGVWLVHSPETPRERRVSLEWLQRGSGLESGPLDRLFGTHRLRLHDGRALRLETSGLSPAQVDLLDRELRRRSGGEPAAEINPGP